MQTTLDAMFSCYKHKVSLSKNENDMKTDQPNEDLIIVSDQVQEIHSLIDVESIHDIHPDSETKQLDLTIAMPMTSKSSIALLEEFETVHGHKYDYSKVKFVNKKTHVDIVCRQHGVFSQRPSCHIKGQGCPVCSRLNRKGEKGFLLAAKDMFEEAITYDYSQFIYIDNKTASTVICPAHGSFQISPRALLKRRQYCPDCNLDPAKIKSALPAPEWARGVTYTTDEWVNKAKQTHGDKYDYDLVEYKGALKEVSIKCTACDNIFQQTANNHLSGRGCPTCGGTSKMTTEEYVVRASKKHENSQYDYSHTNYVDSETTIQVICKSHGEFSTHPMHHLHRGDGCQKCHGNYSKQSIAWLHYIALTENIRIIHAENEGEYYIRLSNKRFPVDGYCSESNTVYQYHGDFFHGNPSVFACDDRNQLNDKTFGDLYSATLSRDNDIRQAGYNLVVMWEKDWLEFCKERGLPSTVMSTPISTEEKAIIAKRKQKEYGEANRERKCFTNKILSQKKQQIKQAQSLKLVEEWVASRIDFSPEYSVRKDVWYKDFQVWCQSTNVNEVAPITIANALMQKYGTLLTRRHSSGTVYQGMKLKDSDIYINDLT